MNTELIAFFSASSVFRKRTPEAQRKAFDETAEDFKAEFDRDLSEDDWQLCCTYVKEKAEAKRKREKAKLERDAAKAAKLAAMPVASGAENATDHIEKREKGRYVLTSAQNNTYADPAFFAALLAYCERHEATLLIGKTLYNKKAFRQPGMDEQDELWFDPKVKPYLVEGHIDLGGAHFIADANVIPTAKWPTSGFEGATPAGIDVIIPATKIELRVVAALKNAKTKRVAATGTVTKRNYITRKTGAIASFNHCNAAMFVDTVNGDFRHLHMLDGEPGFYDFDGFYTASGFVPGADVAALQFGDIHAEKMTDENLDRAEAAIARFKPANVILHDVLDFSSRNHHNIKDPTFLHAQFVAGNTVRGDLEDVTDVIKVLAKAAGKASVHIIESNHDLAVETWIKNADWKTDPINAQVYLKIASAKIDAQAAGDDFNMLEYAFREFGGSNVDNIVFHTTDDSVIVAGVEMGNHGHNGPNGARGNPKSFAGLGISINTGHTHSPSIYWPCFTAGVAASLEMGYNIGPSSWAIADTITYVNGQRQIIFA